MFYLTMHSTHFIYGYMEGKERNVLFNDALNFFYLRLYGVGHIVKDHSYSERENPGYSFRLTARVLLYAQTGQHIPRLLLHQSWNEGRKGDLPLGPNS